jgi:hypothetical protein
MRLHAREWRNLGRHWLQVEKRAAFVQRVAATLAAGATSVQGAIAVAQWGYFSAPPVAS